MGILQSISRHEQLALKAILLTAASIAGLDPVAAQSAPAGAASADDIVVTARFREETVQSIGSSIGVLSGVDLERRNISDFEDVARAVPGVQVLKTQPNSNDISIRGVANANFFSGTGFTISPVVRTFIDDVAVSTAGIGQRDFNSFDMNRIEVLRGPQPTLFGEGAVGGAVRYFTNDPDLGGARVTGVASARVESVQDGSTGYRLEGASSFIVVPDKLGIRVMGFYRDDGGFIDNPTIGKKDINTFESYGGRAVLLARPAEGFELRLSAFISRDDIGEQTQIDPRSDPRDLTFSVAPVLGSSSDDVDLYAGRLTFDLGPVTFSSITGYYKRNSDQTAFNAANTFGLQPFYPGFDTTAFGVSRLREETISQELRLVSDLSGPLNFVGGFFFKSTDVDRQSIISIPGIASAIFPPTTDVSSSQTLNKIEQFSGFLELTGELTDRLRLIGGVRYVHEDVRTTLVSFTAPPLPPVPPAPVPLPLLDFVNVLSLFGIDNSFDFRLRRWLPRAGVEFDAADDVLLYANAGLGVRNGNLNSPLSSFTAAGGGTPGFSQDAFFDFLVVEEDEVFSADIGAKTRWLDNRLTVNVGAFYSEYRNTQITAFLPTAATLNGPDQRILGLELESTFVVNSSLSTYFNMTALDTEFTSDFASVINGPVDVVKGSKAANQPDLAFSFGYALNHPIGSGDWKLISNGGFSYLGPRYSQAQNFPATRLQSLELLDLSVGVENPTWRLTAFVTNLLDDREVVQAGAGSIAPQVDANGDIVDLNRVSAAVNRPRTFGLGLNVRF
jgi:iron complex outermembrane recepter protein